MYEFSFWLWSNERNPTKNEWIQAWVFQWEIERSIFFGFFFSIQFPIRLNEQFSWSCFSYKFLLKTLRCGVMEEQHVGKETKYRVHSYVLFLSLRNSYHNEMKGNGNEIIKKKKIQMIRRELSRNVLSRWGKNLFEFFCIIS